MVIEWRNTVLLPRDDRLAVTREFIHSNVSRSGWDRCWRRPGVSHLQALIPQPEDDEQPKKTFKDYEPVFVHVDVKYLPQRPDEDAHHDLFVGIDRASRGVDVVMLGEKTAWNAAGLLQRLVAKAPPPGAKSPDR